MGVTILDIGMVREVPKNLETLKDIGEVRILYPHHVAHQMLHLKPMLMPQPGITHITQAIMAITDTASAILDIMGAGTDIPITDITGDENKNFEFFFLLQNTTNSSTIWTSWN